MALTATFDIPASGLTLTHKPSATKELKQSPPQIIRLDLVENVTNDLVRAIRNKEQTTLRTGKKTLISFGIKKLSLQATADTFPSEVYQGLAHDADLSYFSGKLSHTLEIQKAQEATSKSDEALAALESTLKSMQEQRASNEASFVRSKADMRQVGNKEHKPSPALGQPSALRKDHLLNNLAKSTPSSPYLSALNSPRHGPTSTPLMSLGGLSTKDKLRLEAIRIPLIHLLAFRPTTSKAAAHRLRVSNDDCERVLDKYARDSKSMPGKKELKEKSYRELDVWKFPYSSREDRQAAIDRAVQAFDRMRIEKTDPLWQILLPLEERGKGKTLSRLNFDKPPPRPSTPRLEGRTHEEGKAEMSDADPKARTRKGATHAKGGQKTIDRKRLGDKEPGPKAATLAREKTATRPLKAPRAGGPKSSERIVDSDEEAEAAPVMPAKPSNPLKRKLPEYNTPAQSPKRPTSTSPEKRQLHKSSLSSSSTISSKSTKPEFDAIKTSNGLKPRPRADTATSRLSPRPRTDSSPRKPSMLGHSEPVNSTDVDSSGSSKAPSQSSAPSSPPSGTDMPLTKQKNKVYSPVIPEKRHDVSRGRSPAKRPSDSSENGPPAKRHQTNGINGIHTNKSANLKSSAPKLNRQTSDSGRSSSPDKPVTSRETVIDEARRFQKFYKKYKDLHERLAQVPEKDRDDKDMENLLQMHTRLREMKSGIWNNWGRVETSITA